MFRSVCFQLILAFALVGNLDAQRPKGGPPGATARKGNRNIVDKWNRMTPDERQKALEKLPPERRQKIEQQLNRYNNLSPEERRQLRNRYQMFNQLPPEKQNQARRLFRLFGELPQERQGMVRGEFETLRAMPEADRRARMNSDEFRNKYNSREQKILGDLSGLLAP